MIDPQKLEEEIDDTFNDLTTAHYQLPSVTYTPRYDDDGKVKEAMYRCKRYAEALRKQLEVMRADTEEVDRDNWWVGL